MASVESILRKHSLEDMAGTQRKRFKTSELPLNSGQRSSIDALLHTFKKKGEFDALRKKVWAGFNESDAKTTFTTALTDLAETEIDREPSLLSRDRGKAATLIEGAVDRSSIYKTVEAGVDLLIAEHLSHVERAVRDIRRHEVGDEVAAEEERKGNKTEPDYEREAELRRQAREKLREEELEVQRQVEEEKAKIKAEERRKKRELERQKEDEEREKEKEREENRRLEREKELEEERRLEEEREREHEERRERRRREEREKERIREREYERGRYRGREGRASPWGGEATFRRNEVVKSERPMTPVRVPEVDEKALEEAALELLLKEGQELAAKSRQKPELERSESLEPPPRRGQLSKSRLGEPSPQKSAEDHKSPVKVEVKEENVEKTDKTEKTERMLDSSPAAGQPSATDHNDRQSPSLDCTTSNHRRDSMDIDKPPKHRENRHHSRSRSRTRHSTRGESTTQTPSNDTKEAYKQAAARQREREAEAWKRATRDHRLESPNPKPRSRSRSPSTKDRDLDKRRDRDDTRRRRRSSSRSPARRRKRERTRSRSLAPPSRNNRRVARSRSRTPPPRKSYVERSRTPLRRHNSRRDARSKSPVEIDRYVPSGGGGGGRGRESPVGRRRARSGERERDREREREREERHRYTEIDRYVPGGGEAEEGRGGRRRSRSRKRDRSRSRSKGSRRYD